jgi:thiol:disulfide interchange protein
MEQVDLKNHLLDVKNFTDKNSLKNIIKDKNGIIILFYADWCGHCKMIKPIYKTFIDKNNKNVIIKAVDMTENSNPSISNLSKMLNIEGFPTIISFDKEGNIFSNFNGRRTLDNLEKYAINVGDYNYLKNNINLIKGGSDPFFTL